MKEDRTQNSVFRKKSVGSTPSVGRFAINLRKFQDASELPVFFCALSKNVNT